VLFGLFGRRRGTQSSRAPSCTGTVAKTVTQHAVTAKLPLGPSVTNNTTAHARFSTPGYEELGKVSIQIKFSVDSHEALREGSATMRQPHVHAWYFVNTAAAIETPAADQSGAFLI
jgi:hypothetical protein